MEFSPDVAAGCCYSFSLYAFIFDSVQCLIYNSGVTYYIDICGFFNSQTIFPCLSYSALGLAFENSPRKDLSQTPGCKSFHALSKRRPEV